MNEVIPPKPTTYGGIHFRSRLEARWAVCLDWYRFVKRWTYEPPTYAYPNGDTNHTPPYTPDFYFETGYLKALLEVKPSRPTDSYLALLRNVSEYFDIPVFLADGDFYNGVPCLTRIDHKKHERLPVTAVKLLPNISQAVQVAAYYRFDLANQPTPPWRQPITGEFDYHTRRWAAQERRRAARR